jgi:hypothetical protein
MSCAEVRISHDYNNCVRSLYREGISRARKEYVCCECGVGIRVGERYQWASGKCSDGMFRAQTCLVCAEIRAAFVCGSWIFGLLWESICDEMFPVWQYTSAIDCLAKLTSDAAVAMCQTEYVEWLEGINWLTRRRIRRTAWRVVSDAREV